MNFFSLFKRKLIYKFKKKKLIDKDIFEKNSLDELFYHYGSDKADYFKIKNSEGHGFSRFYIKHLSELKNKKINILELGSYAGASAAAFIKYFPKSKVFCFDINISNFLYSSKNIFVYGVDIKKENKVNKILKKIFHDHQFQNFDIIIDDGSHYLSDILFSFNKYFKFVKNQGYYIIEDFKHPNYYKYNRDIDDILIDNLFEKIKSKKSFKSNILNENDINYFFKSIKNIYIYKGKLLNSDIEFIKKN